MGLYGNQILPRVINVVCGTESGGEQRARVCAGLFGEVIEIGFGSGHNVAHYPGAVTSVAAVEPSDVAWQLAADRVASAPMGISRAGLDGQVLTFPDGTFDSAVSAWTLCTVADAAAALAEIRRVLKPGGRLHFLEHGLAPDASVQRWQRRLEPAQKRLAGGCHLTRPMTQLIERAGFTITELDLYYEPGSLRALGAMSLGQARAPRAQDDE